MSVSSLLRTNRLVYDIDKAIAVKNDRVFIARVKCLETTNNDIPRLWSNIEDGGSFYASFNDLKLFDVVIGCVDIDTDTPDHTYKLLVEFKN